MKIFLLQDVKKVGKKYEVKEVSEGYARNFLIPKKLAIPADEKAMAVKERIESEEKALIAKLQDLAQKIKKEVLEFKVRTGAKGEVFGSVDAKKIEKTLKDKGYGEIEVKLEKPLRSLGENMVEVDFGKGIKGEATVRLLSQS